MGTVTKLLVFYGHGEEIFGQLLDGVEGGLASGEVSPLCTIMQAFGSDKGLDRHNYTYLYHHLFINVLKSTTDIFELGLGSNFSDVPCNMGPDGVPGASLRGWREYFPNSAICGADIDRRILFQEHRIQTLYVDQTDPASIASLWQHIPHQFDLIIDDGMHELNANSTFLLESKHKLKPQGLYIIEDIYMSAENIFGFDRLLNASGMSGFMYKLPYKRGGIDNAAIVLCGPEWQR